MSEATNPRAVIGGNAPPLAEQLALDHADITRWSTAAVAMVPADIRAPASDEEAADYTDNAAHIKEVLDDANKAHTEAKKPWLDGGRTVDNFFRFRVELQAAATRLSGAIGIYQTAKRAAAMKAQAEADKREREAARIFGGDEPTAAPAPAPKVVAITSASGAQVSGSVRWEHRVVDAALIPRQYLMVNEAALKAAVAGLKAQGGKVDDAKIPGVEIYEAVRAAIRR